MGLIGRSTFLPKRLAERHKLLYTGFMPIVYLTVDEAGERLGVGRQRIYDLIKAGRLKAAKLENTTSWLIEETSVENFTRLGRIGRPRKKKRVINPSSS